MEFQFANLVLSHINVYFPGGVIEFVKEGAVALVPTPAKEVVVYHPDMGGELVRKLTELKNNSKNGTVHIMAEKNFKGVDSEGLLEIKLELNRKIEALDPGAGVLYVDRSNLVVVSLPGAKDGVNSVPEQVAGCLRNTEGLSLSYVITGHTVQKIILEKSKQIPDKKEGLAHGVITKDDVTDLTIVLEQCRSVDDFLKLAESGLPGNGEV